MDLGVYGRKEKISQAKYKEGDCEPHDKVLRTLYTRPCCASLVTRAQYLVV